MDGLKLRMTGKIRQVAVCMLLSKSAVLYVPAPRGEDGCFGVQYTENFIASHTAHSRGLMLSAGTRTGPILLYYVEKGGCFCFGDSTLILSLALSLRRRVPSSS